MRKIKQLFSVLFILLIGVGLVSSVKGEVQPFSFVIYSDIQIGYSELVDSYGNNNTLRYQHLIDVLNTNYSQGDFDFALNLGDNVCGDGLEIWQWSIWNSTTQNVVFPIYHVKGNHDGNSSVTNFEAYTNNDVNYFFDHLGVRFLFVGTEETFLLNEACGLAVTETQKEYIINVTDDQLVWLVSHYPSREYWSDTELLDSIASQLIGYSGGHEDTTYSVEELDYININMLSVCLYEGINEDILPFASVSIRDDIIQVDLYDAYTMEIISENQFVVSKLGTFYSVEFLFTVIAISVLLSIIKVKKENKKIQ